MSNTLARQEDRRPEVVDAALRAFAETGYWNTTMVAVAERAGISQAYVFKIHRSKEALFVAALEECFARICHELERAADACRDSDPTGEPGAAALDAMGEAYADLIADRSLLMLQVHAQSAATIAPVAVALRRGLASVVETVSQRSGAPDHAVQRFMAYGQLCHLVTVAGVDAGEVGVTVDQTRWLELLGRGLRHVG